MRDMMATLIAPALKLTGFRFSKDYRWGTTVAHRLVSKVLNTTRANQIAGV